MTRRLGLFFLALLVLACAACGSDSSSKDPQSFTGGTITVVVPTGWVAQYNEGAKQVIVATADDKTVASVQFVDSSGKSQQEFAEMLANALGGGSVQPTADGKSYFFEFNSGGMGMMGITSVKGDIGMFFLKGGEYPKYEKEIQGIWDTMKSSDADEQALFKDLQ